MDHGLRDADLIAEFERLRYTENVAIHLRDLQARQARRDKAGSTADRVLDTIRDADLVAELESHRGSPAFAAMVGVVADKQVRRDRLATLPRDARRPDAAETWAAGAGMVKASAEGVS